MDMNTLTDNCNRFLDETMNVNDLPGLAVGVSVGGVEGGVEGGMRESDAATPVEFVGVRGYKDYAARTPLEVDDIFHCASVSKLFTSSAVMKLVEAGVLDLNARLVDILPDLRIVDRRCEEIRLWNMLTHTSGLGDVEDYHWYDHETDEVSLRRYVYESDEVLNQPMLWEPQETRFRYSNVAYEILGQIVSEYSIHMPDAEGKLSYEDFVARYLLEPAGMADSTMKTFEREGDPDYLTNPHMAMPHEKKSDRSIGPVKYYPYTRQHAPSSTLTSNVRDLLRWGRAHLASSCGAAIEVSSDTESTAPLLKPETYQKIWRPYATVPNNGEQMGLGWFMREQTVNAPSGQSTAAGSEQAPGTDDSPRTFRLLGHEGTDDGFHASFWLCPELDLVTVVLSNLSGAPVKRINKKLFDTVAQI